MNNWIIDDFNYKRIAWPKKITQRGEIVLSIRKQNNIINIMDKHSTELVDFPTWQGNILDLILTIPDDIENVHYINLVTIQL